MMSAPQRAGAQASETTSAPAQGSGKGSGSSGPAANTALDKRRDTQQQPCWVGMRPGPSDSAGPPKDIAHMEQRVFSAAQGFPGGS